METEAKALATGDTTGMATRTRELTKVLAAKAQQESEGWPQEPEGSPHKPQQGKPHDPECWLQEPKEQAQQEP
jgi:hypothetical protein